MRQKVSVSPGRIFVEYGKKEWKIILVRLSTNLGRVTARDEVRSVLIEAELWRNTEIQLIS